jgi:hypothetical protein
METKKRKKQEENKRKRAGLHGVISSTLVQPICHYWALFLMAPWSIGTGTALLSKTRRHLSFQMFQVVYIIFCNRA